MTLSGNLIIIALTCLISWLGFKDRSFLERWLLNPYQARRKNIGGALPDLWFRACRFHASAVQHDHPVFLRAGHGGLLQAALRRFRLLHLLPRRHRGVGAALGLAEPQQPALCHARRVRRGIGGAVRVYPAAAVVAAVHLFHSGASYSVRACSMSATRSISTGRAATTSTTARICGARFMVCCSPSRWSRACCRRSWPNSAVHDVISSRCKSRLSAASIFRAG